MLTVSYVHSKNRRFRWKHSFKIILKTKFQTNRPDKIVSFILNSALYLFLWLQNFEHKILKVTKSNLHPVTVT